MELKGGNLCAKFSLRPFIYVCFPSEHILCLLYCWRYFLWIVSWGVSSHNCNSFSYFTSPCSVNTTHHTVVDATTFFAHWHYQLSQMLVLLMSSNVVCGGADGGAGGCVVTPHIQQKSGRPNFVQSVSDCMVGEKGRGGEGRGRKEHCTHHHTEYISGRLWV